MVSCSHVLSAVTILTQVVALVNDFVRKVVKAGTGARRPVGSFSSFVSAGGARNVAEPKR